MLMESRSRRPEESAELVKLAERAGVIFQVGHLERFNAVMALAERAQNPRFIEVIASVHSSRAPPTWTW
jgi:predicted dehydrogenase